MFVLGCNVTYWWDKIENIVHWHRYILIECQLTTANFAPQHTSASDKRTIVRAGTCKIYAILLSRVGQMDCTKNSCLMPTAIVLTEGGKLLLFCYVTAKSSLYEKEQSFA